MKLFKNTILAAACIALVLAPVAASTQSNKVRIHVRSYEQKEVEDSTDSYDSADSTDSYDSNDSTESYESVDSYDSSAEYLKGFSKISCPGGSPMSVEGVAGVFCVYGDACSGNNYGNCPDAQSGLEQGAYCGTVKSGALGCKLSSDGARLRRHHHLKSQQIDCPGGSPMSVEGVAGVFCVTGQACVANISNGACPGPQTGLPSGASCGVVRTGVYGCKPNSGTAPASTSAPVYNPAHAPPTTSGPVYNPAHAPPTTGSPVYNPAHAPPTTDGPVYNPAHAPPTTDGPVYNPAHAPPTIDGQVYNPAHAPPTTDGPAYNPAHAKPSHKKHHHRHHHH